MTALRKAMEKVGIKPLSNLRKAAMQCIGNAKSNSGRAKELFWGRVRKNPEFLIEIMGGALMARSQADRYMSHVLSEMEPAPTLRSVPTPTAPQRVVTMTVPRIPYMARLESAGAVAEKTFYDTFRLINGQRLDQLTAGEARAWARTHRKDAALIEEITANLPDTARIGEFRSADEAAKIAAKFEGAYHD